MPAQKPIVANKVAGDSLAATEVNSLATAGVAHATQLDTHDIKIGNTYAQEFNSRAYYDGSNDDSNALEAFFNECAAANGKAIIKAPDGRLPRLTRPIVIKPRDTQSEIKMSMDFISGIDMSLLPSGTQSNKTVGIQIIGVRNSTIRNATFGFSRNSSQSNMVGIDLDTRAASGAPNSVNQQSTTGLIFEGGGGFLGGGVNNIGVRMGQVSGSGGDISQIIFRNFNITSAADNGLGQHTGAQNCISGQIAHQNVGRNTLNITYDNCIMSYCDTGYDNSVNGNGAVTWINQVNSHNRLNYRIGAPQNYTFIASRCEDSIREIHVNDGDDTATFLYLNCLWDNLVLSNGQGFFFGRPANVRFIGGMVQNSYVNQDKRLMRFNSFSQPSNPDRRGLVRIEGLGVQGAAGANAFYEIEDEYNGGAPRFRVNVQDCPILDGSNKIIGYYAPRYTTS